MMPDDTIDFTKPLPDFVVETQWTVAEFHRRANGASSSNMSLAVMANDEMAAVLTSLAEDDENEEAWEKIADTVITLYRLATRMGINLAQAVHDEMQMRRGTFAG